MVMKSSSQTNNRAANALRSNSKSGGSPGARGTCSYPENGCLWPICSIRSGQNECQFLRGAAEGTRGESGSFPPNYARPVAYNRYIRPNLAVRVAAAVSTAWAARRLRAAAGGAAARVRRDDREQLVDLGAAAFGANGLGRTADEQFWFFSTLLAGVFVQRHGVFLIVTSGRLAAGGFRWLARPGGCRPG